MVSGLVAPFVVRLVEVLVASTVPQEKVPNAFLDYKKAW